MLNNITVITIVMLVFLIETRKMTRYYRRLQQQSSLSFEYLPNSVKFSES